MNHRLHIAATRLVESKTHAVVVEVVRAEGSVPREVGTRMIVTRDACYETVGGGHLELSAITSARKLCDGALRDPQEHHYPLGPALGQCCGGAVTLRFSTLTAEMLSAWPITTPRFVLQMYGAGHVGRAIARLLADIDCCVQWIDEREDQFPLEPSAPHIERISLDAVEAEVAMAPPGALYLVLTHSHELDMRITESVLKRGDFAYLGLIGSKTKRARFLRRFEDQGMNRDVLARLKCPIGIEGILGKEPEVIAIGVVAELLQVSAP